MFKSEKLPLAIDVSRQHQVSNSDQMSSGSVIPQKITLLYLEYAKLNFWTENRHTD